LILRLGGRIWGVFTAVSQPTSITPETDSRFPSGKWVGFFLQRLIPGRHMMELLLTFSNGTMTGEGRDLVGKFVIRGGYTLHDGKCHFHKRYVGKHDVFYQGFNEGKGIWGVWAIPASKVLAGQKGGFHIWPEGMSDPSQQHLTEAAELPRAVDEPADSKERIAEPVARKR
jgi:hypothetical protein